MEKNINIIKYGTPVITKSGKINAFITGVCIRGENMTYELSYFDGGTHNEVWLYRFEFDVNESQPKKAGFDYDNKTMLING